jgi:hypothetical protein
LYGAVWDFVIVPGGILVFAYGSLSGCPANRQIMFAIILENLCSQAFKKRMDCEGGGLWKDVVSGFYYAHTHTRARACVCVCVCGGGGVKH